jgi:hypothetical protein
MSTVEKTSKYVMMHLTLDVRFVTPANDLGGIAGGMTS